MNKIYKLLFFLVTFSIGAMNVAPNAQPYETPKDKENREKLEKEVKQIVSNIPKIDMVAQQKQTDYLLAQVEREKKEAERLRLVEQNTLLWSTGPVTSFEATVESEKQKIPVAPFEPNVRTYSWDQGDILYNEALPANKNKTGNSSDFVNQLKKLSVPISGRQMQMDINGRTINRYYDNDIGEVSSSEYAEYLKDKKNLCRSRWKSIPTQVASVPVALGLYKRDILEAGLLGANLYGDYLMFKYFKELRIKNTISYLMDNIDEIETLITEALRGWIEYDRWFATAPWWKRAFTAPAINKLTKLAPITEHMKKHMPMVTWKFYKKNSFLDPKIIGPILLRYAGDIVSEKIENKYIAKEHLDFNLFKIQVPECLEQGYEKTADGKYTPIPRGSAPISIMNIIKFFLQPRYFAKSIFSNARALWGTTPNDGSKPAVYWANKMFGWNLPEKLFSNTAIKYGSIAFDIFAIFWTVKAFDESCNNKWSLYMVERYDEVIVMLREYKKAKKESTTETKSAALIASEDRIRKFVEAAYESNSIFPGSQFGEWMSCRDWGILAMDWYKVLPITAYALWKMGSWFKYYIIDPRRI